MEKNKSGPKIAMFISITAIIMAIFHLYTAGFGRFPALQQRSIHLAFTLILTFFIYPISKGTISGKWSMFINCVYSGKGRGCTTA